MPIPSTTRNDRIELRASRKQKRTLATACEHLVMMRTALPGAEEIVARGERIALSARDSLRVRRLLEHPPKPTAALRAAAKKAEIPRVK